MAEYDDARAATYDATRSASESMVGALLRALGQASGRSLLDIGGGTGNYSVAMREAGFQVTPVELSEAMARRAAAKLGTDAIVQGDALRLPFRDASFDCAVSVNVSHHLDWWAHIAEAKRVVGNGTFAMQVNTRENLAAHWIFEYFPAAKEPTLALHPPAEEVAGAMRSAGFRDAGWEGLVFGDQADATFEALKHWPGTYLDDGYRRNTTFFTRMPAGLERTGVARLRKDHASGALAGVIARYEPLAREAGDSTVFVGRG
jgi:ubiquinone/menaquinone biosynthesis C-methylase UbiE